MTKTENIFLLNPHGHYFEIDSQAFRLNRDDYQGCRFFDNEESLLQAVCADQGLCMDEVSGSTFYVTQRNGEPVIIDDRAIPTAVDAPLADYLTQFEL